MNHEEASVLIRDLMNRHGLTHWELSLDRALRRFGMCSHQRRVISLSKHLVSLNDHASVVDTTLHEIAHALAGPKAGHGPHWKKVAREIGCQAERCFDSDKILLPPAKFQGTCPNCGVVVARNRKRRGVACARCCKVYAGGKFDSKFLFVWSENPERINRESGI